MSNLRGKEGMNHASNTIDVYLSRHISHRGLNGNVAFVNYNRDNGVTTHREEEGMIKT
jgi:hypothetical protein